MTQIRWIAKLTGCDGVGAAGVRRGWAGVWPAGAWRVGDLAMGRYIIRRILTSILTLIAISFVIFAILDLAPGDPTSNLPLTIKPEVRQKIRESLGLDQPFAVRYALWMKQFFITEPLNILETTTGIKIGDSKGRLRLTSWTTKVPVVDLIAQRIPQTL